MKRYADEPSHESIRSLDGLIASAIARVEVPAALWRKQRIGELSSSDVEVLVTAFRAELIGTPTRPPGFAAVPLDTEVLDLAAEATATHSLRAYDAVQLASALVARSADPSCERFACFDDELRDAAARSGFGLIPV